MNAKKIDRYREQLRALAAKMQSDFSTVEEQTRLPTGGQAAGGLSNTPMHLADMGTDAILQETNSVLLENEQYLLSEIQAALERVDNGEFGRCESCGKSINEERLEALPYVRTCVRCAEKLERSARVNLDSGRPKVETETIAAEEKQLKRRDPGGERGPIAFTNAENDAESRPEHADVHAAGTAGGGTALGGLAGTNIGRGDPRDSELESATGSSQFDVDDQSEQPGIEAFSGHAGGAVGGTPAGKRASKPTSDVNRRTGEPTRKRSPKRRRS